MEAIPDISVQQTKITYPTLASFIQKTRQLLKEQQKHQVDFFNQMIQSKTIQQIEEEGYGLSNMLVISEKQGFYGKIILTIIKQYHSEKSPILIPEQCKLQVGDDVAIMKNNIFLASGVVYKRIGAKIKVSISEKNNKQQYDYEGTNCHLVLRWNQVTFKRYFNVLQDLEQFITFKSSKVVHKLFPEAYDLNVKHKNHQEQVTQQDKINFKTMNHEQIKAIKMGLNQVIHLIHGPPGTGKTTTVCELIVSAVKKGQKVLACAPSNIAVDNIVQSIGKRLKCVRIGNPARVIQTILSHCLDSLVISHTNQWKAQVKKLQATRKRLSKIVFKQQRRKVYFQMKQLQSQIHLLQQQVIEQILNEADVICATNVGAADRVFKKYLSQRKFDLVVIDECGQGLQISCWIPLLKAKRAVLAGDHKQLPPTIKGAQNSLLSYTLFSRAMNQLSNITSTMLIVQYRMNKLIMGWSNQMFYNQKLVAHESVKDHVLKGLYKNVEENQEVVMMIDTTGCKMGEKGEENQSKINVGQADISISIYKKILSYGVSPKHIAILTPYSKQVALIKSLLNQLNLPLTDVSTVDGIQGRQKQCIIISLVRSNKHKQIGFLKDWRRMNVAVTRARRMLVLIGNCDCVTKDQNIATLIKWIDQHGKIISALQFKNDPLVRFGEGVEDQENFDSHTKNEKENVQKKKTNRNQTASNQIKTNSKPQIYEAHTYQQIQILKEHYKALFNQIKDQIKFPGASNFQRKIIHEVAQQMGLNHETSTDKKQIKVWLKQSSIIDDNISCKEVSCKKEENIKVKGSKDKLNPIKEEIDKKTIIQKKESTKIASMKTGGFGEAIKNLMLQDENSDEEREVLKQEPVNLEEKPQQSLKKQNKSKKTAKSIIQSSQLTTEQQQEMDDFLSQLQKVLPKKQQCFKCKRKITSVTSVRCKFCNAGFCQMHVLAQEHGCDKEAKQEARGNYRELDRLCQIGAEKIKQKIKEQENARKKGKNQKNKKK